MSCWIHLDPAPEPVPTDLAQTFFFHYHHRDIINTTMPRTAPKRNAPPAVAAKRKAVEVSRDDDEAPSGGEGGGPAESPRALRTRQRKAAIDNVELDEDESQLADHFEAQLAAQGASKKRQPAATAMTSPVRSPLRRSPRQSPSAMSARSSDSASSTRSSTSMSVVQRKDKRIRDVKRLTKNGFDAWIGALARAAVFDTLPPLTGEVARKLHLFWPRLPPHEVALSLIKRTPQLQKESVEHGGLLDFAIEIAPVVMLHSRKARNKHVNQLRDVFFTPASKSQLAHNVLADQLIDSNGTVRAMKLTDAVAHLTTVDALCDLLKSSDLHADRVVYPLFVMGLAAGKMSKIRKQPDTVPLAQFINVNYEAHFRAEMWFSLNKQGRLSNHHDHIIIIITFLPRHHHHHIIICNMSCLRLIVFCCYRIPA